MMKPEFQRGAACPTGPNVLSDCGAAWGGLRRKGVLTVMSAAGMRKRLALQPDRYKISFGMVVTPDQGWARLKVEGVAFTREELSRILGLYGQFVAAGEWRDYAIDHLRDAAVFSIFRRAAETPIYRVEKRPALANRQGAWAVISMTGVILKRGHDLAQVLRLFDRQRLKLAE